MSKALTDQQVKSKALVDEAVGNGYAIASQCNDKEGHITYKVLGGMYDGAEYRMYPPFLFPVQLGNPEVGHDTYVPGPPKDKRTPKLTLRRA